MIFAETFFVRERDAPTCPIFVLGVLESKRRIEVNKKDSKQIPELIRNHYEKLDNGICSIWGKVQEYHHYHKGKCDIYSVTGSYIKTSDNTVPSNGACICLK